MDASEIVLDHQIHLGSFEYSLILTDQGKLHIYHIYDKFDDGYRGFMQVSKGSNAFKQDTTGLYICVPSPHSTGYSYDMHSS